MAERHSDGELVARALAGDQGAFGELVARYRDAVFGVAFHRIGNFENARDVAQDAFLKAYANLPKLRKPESFASWLYHIADLTALEVVRRPRQEVPLPADETALGSTESYPSVAEEADLAQQVREALATLNEPTRLAVILHYVNGYSHAEVASFLDTTPGAVRTRVSRAKKRLREEVLGMVHDAFRRTQHGFVWLVRHPSGKAEASIGVSGWPEERREEVRELAHALYWLNPDLRSEPGWQEKRDQAARQWVQYILKQAASRRPPQVSVTKTEHAAGIHELGTLITQPRSPRGGWLLPDYALQPLREAFAKMAGVTLGEATEAVEGIIRFEHEGRRRTFAVEFRPTTVQVIGDALSEVALDGPPGRYECIFQEEGRQASVDMDAASPRDVLRQISKPGRRIVSIWQVTEKEQEETAIDPIARIVDVILSTALIESAQVIRAQRRQQGSGEVVSVEYLIFGTWHERMTIPTYVWAPLREALSGMCEDTLQPTEDGQAGKLSFGLWGRDFDADISMTDDLVEVTLARTQ